MQLAKKIQITIFAVTNDVFEPLGDVSQYTSLIWPDAFNGYASFELWAPITDDNREFLKKGNIIWCGGENAAVIESVKSSIDNQGEKTFNVKGRTLEKFLLDRILWGTFVLSGPASTVMYSLVNSCAINPANPDRKIPWLVNAYDTRVGNVISKYQKTGGALYDALKNIAAESDIGFSVLFDPRNRRLVFEVRAGADRTQGNTQGNDPVIFSTELEDILASSYYSNNMDEKSVAFVQGEDTGAERRSVTVGAVSGKGFARKELYVDARDLQSELTDEDGQRIILTDPEYLGTLNQRGNEKLALHVSTEVFEAQIRQFGDVQYVFGQDYFKGDKVTVVDEQLGIMVSARITNVEEDYDDEYNLVLTFGYSFPTILQQVKRAIE